MFSFNMLLLVFVVLLGTVVTVNIDKPDVKMHNTDLGNNTMLTCRAKGFITSDIILNIKKNHCVLTKEDGVNTTGVHPDKDTYWGEFQTYRRRDHVIVPQSEVSHYSCEVSHDLSRFRVEKVWVPDSVGGGRIISSKFIDTTPPEVKMLSENYEDGNYIILVCLVSGFYPNNITLNMKRNGHILTRVDGVKSSGVCSNKEDTFQITDSLTIKNADKSNYSCEVIHDASRSGVEMFWNHQLLASPSDPGPGSDGDAGSIIGVVASILVLILVIVLRIRGLFGCLNRAQRIYTPAPTMVVVVARPGHDYNHDGRNLLDGNAME
ncbi:uncharacterized protein LOC125019726 [Mugil cephalus]|uniref:uncharacterized protein LOC125019726 n=1 Tax=Mugil cephalus TaxID=48193 RepID=UPI001FB774E3|nr:uncharacterized protein LOC125019726 [Mugil cephalus]